MPTVKFVRVVAPPIQSASRLFSFTVSNEMVEEEEPDDEEPIGEEPMEEEPIAIEKDELLLFHRFRSPTLEYRLDTDRTIYGYAIFDATGRRLLYANGQDITTNTIDIATFNSAIYYLAIYHDEGIISKAFAK